MDIHETIAVLRRVVREMETPVVGVIQERWRDPFKTLVSCILSLRTQDKTTRQASMRLFALADTPQALVDIPLEQVREAIYPVGFYRRKAEVIQDVCRDLLSRFDGKVPDDLDDLLTLKGVGRKTANLVVTVGFGKPGICVDTHVHRISNRWGYVETRNPGETEKALRGKLPPEYWIEFNDLLVTFGQNVCLPISPYCSRCPIRDFCKRLGVKKSR